jgi:hypothetical protein
VDKPTRDPIGQGNRAVTDGPPYQSRRSTARGRRASEVARGGRRARRRRQAATVRPGRMVGGKLDSYIRLAGPAAARRGIRPPPARAASAATREVPGAGLASPSPQAAALQPELGARFGACFAR